MWGGSKDVGRNESKQGINRIQKFVESNKHTNIILMEVPHRHDLMQESCVNKEVERYNSRMRKYMKIYKNVTVLQVNLDRSGFTTHGQHMNIMWKELLAERIAETIKRTVKVYKIKAINMKWKDDPSIETQGTRKFMDGVGEGGDSTASQNNSTQVEDGDKRRKENKGPGKATDGAGEGGDSIVSKNDSIQVDEGNNRSQENEGLGKAMDGVGEEGDSTVSKNDSTQVEDGNNRRQESEGPGKTTDGVGKGGNSTVSKNDTTQVEDGDKRRQENEGPGKAMDGVGEGGDSTVRKNASTQVEDGNNGRQENELAAKVSGRTRKTSVKRTDDFLWTVNCKKHSR